MGVTGGIALIAGIFLVGAVIIGLLVRSILRGRGGHHQVRQRGPRQRPLKAAGGAAMSQAPDPSDLRREFSGAHAPRAENEVWYMPSDAQETDAEPPTEKRPRGAGRYYDPNARQDVHEHQPQ